MSYSILAQRVLIVGDGEGRREDTSSNLNTAVIIDVPYSRSILSVVTSGIVSTVVSTIRSKSVEVET